ncbi:MAG: hypothetical protein J6S36_03620 [Eggerthellaceae bacterium]|nr:hypothetical protein [Eggerthellaceae bacterium]
MYSATESFVAWLSGEGYAASTWPAADAPDEFVTVERTGGGTSDMVDHPTMAVQTWAPTEARAEEMAIEIRNKLMCQSRPRGITKVNVNSGPYPFWDEDTRCPRYQVIYDCTSILD